jgi:membrane associated rhomboid family serine protease
MLKVPEKSSEPIFNIPAVMVALIALLVLVHVGRVLLLSPDDDVGFLTWFAFIPARYDSELLQTLVPGDIIPSGLGPQIWTFLTYAFLHADFTHLFVNTIWLLPFGTAVARRFGTWRFVLLFVATSVAGALAHLATHSGEVVFMIGASGAVSGLMAAAIRFAFQSGGPLENWRRNDPAAYMIPAAPLSVALRNPRVVIFVVMWFGFNILFGVGVSVIPGTTQEIAWQTHIGGFLAGLILFPFFDPVGAAQHRDENQGGDAGDDTEPPPTLH